MRIPFISTSEITEEADEVDYRQPLDLNELLISSPASTFLLRAQSNRLGVSIGDILVVDRGVTPRNGQLVIGIESGEMRLQKAPVAEIWGAVTHVIKSI